MGSNSLPLISAIPGTDGNSGGISDSLASASPILQQLLGQTGGPSGLHNVDSLAAANPAMGNILSLMSPGGGLSPEQSNQFGPLFALLMSLSGGSMTPGTGGT